MSAAPEAGKNGSGSPRPVARPFRRFVGVGLGGGRGKNTAIARLESRIASDGRESLVVVEAKTRYGHRGTGRDVPESREGMTFRDDVLVDYLRRWTDDTTVVSMDAPLTVPACIRCNLPCPGVAECTVPVVQWMKTHSPALVRRRRADASKPHVTPYTQRATEILLSHEGLHPRESLGQGTGPLAARATYLRRALSPMLRLHENLIEVHPRATLIRTVGAERERKTRQGDLASVWEHRKAILREMADVLQFDTVWPELVARHIQVFHAVVSAFTAYRWSRESWATPTGCSNEDDVVADDPLPKAIHELGTLWIEDGWIVLPPASHALRK